MNTSSSSSSSSSEDEYIIVRRRKIYRKRENYFNKYNENEFFDRFRLTKDTVFSLLQRIEHQIALPTNRGGCIQPVIQILLCLRFYATGNMLITVADFTGVSKSSACRIIRRVSAAIASLLPEYIYMYRNINEIHHAAQAFYNFARFPKVIGAIDCTLIKIESPGGEDAEIFRSRKGYFALNVQTVSDANLRIRNLITRWPGSCHDQTIFNSSNLKQEFEDGRYGQYILVGDSGYAIEPYLMTPLQNTQNASENLYNESQIRTRNVVERQYGVWKRRFPILSLGMRVQLPTIMNIVAATAVLHNIAIDMNEVIPEEWLDNAVLEEAVLEEAVEAINNNNNNNRGRGRNVRRLLINEHFLGCNI